MKEDLAISKNTILALQEENRQLKHQQQRLENERSYLVENQTVEQATPTATSKPNLFSGSSSDTEVDAATAVAAAAQSQSAVGAPALDSVEGSLSVPDLSKKLLEERSSKERLESELQTQKRLKDEMDTAMKLMEKDVHEKQDTIISLRSQLDDIKMINLEMYKKLQVNDWNIIDNRFAKTNF